MSELPDRWATATVGEINRFSGRTINPKSTPGIEYELYSVPIFPTGRPELIRGSAIGSTKQAVEPNDVLVCKINPRINRVWVVGRRGERPQIASSEWIAVRAPEFDARYLMGYFSSPAFRELIEEGVSGVGGSLTRAQPKRVATFPVPVAPAPQQKRISDKLDAVLARVDACRERLDRVPAILKRFRDAVLEAAVSGRLTEEWRVSTNNLTSGQALAQMVTERHMRSTSRGAKAVEAPSVDEIREIPSSWGWVAGAAAVDPSADIVYGIVQPGPKLRDGVPYVRGMDIENGRILVGQLMRTSPAIAARYERASLKGGDVLLGIIRATKVAIVPDELAGANITQGTARLRPSPEIRTGYLARALEAPLTQKWLHGCYRGIDMPGLNLADVRRVPIPLPSIDEQDEIVRRVDELFVLADQLEVKYRAAVERVERLTPAVLAKAFRGELVPQDPSDEPASVLLERIRKKREAVSPKAAKVTKVRARRVAPRKSSGRRRGRAS